MKKSLNYGNISISLIEQKVLMEICKEKNSKQIAETLHVPEHRIRGIKERLRNKIGCKSVIGLVMFAIKYKIVLN